MLRLCGRLLSALGSLAPPLHRDRARESPIAAVDSQGTALGRRGRVALFTARRIVAWLAALATAAAVSLAIGGSGAHAAHECQKNFDGEDEQDPLSWTKAKNWDSNELPKADQIVCIDEAARINATDSVSVKSIRVGGRLTVHGTLELTDLLDPSVVAGTLHMDGGMLRGSGNLHVVGELIGKGGASFTGRGTTTVYPLGTFRIEHQVRFAKHRLVNNGTLDWHFGPVYHNDGPVIENNGTFKITGAGGGVFYQTSLDGEPLSTPLHLKNNGTIRNEAPGHTYIEAAWENDGAVESTTGQLNLQGGDAGRESSGRFGRAGDEGVVNFDTGQFSGLRDATFDGKVALTGADMVGESSFTVVDKAVLALDGSWLKGAGTMTIASGGTAEIVGFGGFQDGWKVVNEGTFKFKSGIFRHTGGPEFLNRGLFTVEAGSYQETKHDPNTAPPMRFVNESNGRLTLPENQAFMLDTSLRNDGVVEVGKNATLGIEEDELLENWDDTTGTLSGGSFQMKDGTLDLRLDTDEKLVHNASHLVLEGPDSRLKGNPVTPEALVDMRSNALTGRFELANRSVTTNGPLDTTGIIALHGPSALTLGGRLLQVHGIVVLNDGASSLATSEYRLDDGFLGGVGHVKSAVLQIGGSVGPGVAPKAPGVLKLNAYSKSGGTLDIDVAGQFPLHDRVEVVDHAALNGRLSLHRLPIYAAGTGTSHQVIKAGSRSGAFSSLLGGEIDQGRFYEATYGDAEAHVIARTRTASASDARVQEGARVVPVQVELSHPSATTVKLDYVTEPGGAVAGADYAPARGTLDIRPGTTSGVVNVPIQDDAQREGDENFTVRFTNPQYALLAKDAAQVTIADDDAGDINNTEPITTPNKDVAGDANTFGSTPLVDLEVGTRPILPRGPIKVVIENGNRFRISGTLTGRTSGKVSTARKRIARLKPKSFTVAGNAKTTVKLKLPKPLQRVLNRKRKLSLRLTATLTDPTGQTRVFNQTVKLRAKKAPRKR